MPNEEMVKLLWKQSVVAYWKWMKAVDAKALRDQRLKKVEADLAARIIEVRQRHWKSKIHRIRQKMGIRFASQEGDPEANPPTEQILQSELDSELQAKE